VIGMGDDAGFIYQIYGFGLIRGMELHQEAGFHPLKVIQQTTANNAQILGQEARLGRVRAGWLADLILVNGNPIEDLKVLYPSGPGGIEWTIKDGVTYHGPTLLREVREIVARDGVVYVGDLSGVFHAVRAGDGKGLWTFATHAEIKSSPVVVGDRVLIGSYDGNLYCLSARDGKLLWTVTTSNYVHATPVVSD